MNLIAWDKTHSALPCVVLLFGSGLIGGAIANALQHAGHRTVCKRLDWTWPRPSTAERRAVRLAAEKSLEQRPGAEFAVIWAAGRSGFGSSPDEMAGEFAALDGVLKTTRQIGAGLDPRRCRFVHVSSAGGLFEGQVACDQDAVPRPLRPYGFGKLAQEQFVQDTEGLGRRMILRPSSVYGYTAGARRGLISTLAATGVHRRTATIFGSLMTLRDYVYAPDVGRFVATSLTESNRAGAVGSVETCILASARSASVFEILRLVERYLGQALNLRIDPHPENARHNTFLQSALPAGFQPTALEEGVASTVRSVTGDRFLGSEV